MLLFQPRFDSGDKNFTSRPKETENLDVPGEIVSTSSSLQLQVAEAVVADVLPIGTYCSLCVTDRWLL